MTSTDIVRSEEPVNDPTELTLRDILQRNQFKENDGLLDSEITELESLYSMSKQILMDEANGGASSAAPKRLGTVDAGKKKNFMFIANQTANLISIRKLKMELVRQKADLKRDELDRSIKALVQIAKEAKSGDDEGNPKRVLDFLINNLNINIPIGPSPMLRNEADVDALLERTLEDAGFGSSKEKVVDAEILETIESAGEESQYVREYNGTDDILVYNPDGEKVYVVTKDYEIVRELSEDEYDAEILEDGTFVDTLTNTIIEILE